MKTLSIFFLIFFLASCKTNSSTKPVRNKKEESGPIKIMTFNMFHGGDAGGQPMSKSIAVMRAAEAGIVGVQESHGYGDPRSDLSAQMAGNMGWRHVDQGSYDAIMTKYTIEETSNNKMAVKIKIDKDKFLWIINCHLMYIPYQPYQLNNKKYGDYPFLSTEEEAIAAANKTRKKEVDKLVKIVEEKIKDGWPVIVTGDFNEPSHLDWTQAAAAAGIKKIKVEWPSTRAFTNIGMKDAYRSYRPDEVKYPGNTWTSFDSPGEIHDRIDFIFYIGDQLELISAEVVGESLDKADIAVQNYPSDHRAVVATFEWK
ncbi:Exonuclease III [Saccharicrinis carchari]|uniref:Exonuclease III n=1 Tax=Saccharicrinis carchari TaxID=1168039 RepID=A0A521C0S3_SACCC|nr:endonuclease/exonuclease/phosphatase family protein [Saccharicrinis carchari]SMO52401.1 Exonuclease III [Saccharicrinis carchari]